MSERGKRVFRFLLDPERDADVIGRMEAQPSMTGYVRKLVRRDVHDERLDFAALKASELLAENAKLRSICAEVAGILFNLDVDCCGLCDRDDINHPCPVHTVKGGECLIKSELRELGIEVDG